MPNQESPEVIVIGAGLGGLGAAVELARSGVKVMILERHNLPGGFATSFVRGRFEFEPSLHEMPRSAAVDFLKDVDPNLEFRDIPEAYRLILTDRNVDFRASFGTEAYIRDVVAAAGGFETPIRRFMEACANTTEAFAYLGENSRPSVRRLLKKYGNFVRTAAATTDEVADAVGLPQEARELMYPYWCYLGVPTNRVSFSIWGAMLHAYINQGAVIPAKRSHDMVTALADGVTRAGGEIRYNTEAVEILSKGRKISGVRTASGDTIECDRLISNLSPHQLFGNLSPSGGIPDNILKSVNARQWGFSFFVLYLGLIGSHEDIGLTDYSYFIAPHMDTVALETKVADRYDPEPMLAAVCLNAADPNCSPPGTTILSITVGTRWEAWADIPPWNYHREKMRFASLVINQFEGATGVHIRGRVEEIETAAPPTFSRYAGSWNGTVYGYEPTPWDGIIPRVLFENRERYFENLRFCGGSAFRAYGYGSSLLSGKTAAEKTIREMGK